MKKLIRSFLGHRSTLLLAYHALRAFLAALRYGFPGRRLTIIGITGSDGKTTTVGMVHHIFSTAGIKAGALSTAFLHDGTEFLLNKTQKTSPSPFVVQKLLRTLIRNGCTHAVLEYSSHGLVQHRLDYTWPKVAGITNTSEEHLDYHKTMEQYRRDKRLLFKMTGPKGIHVLNTDDETYKTYKDVPAEKKVEYSTAHVDIQATTHGTSATVEGEYIELQLLGAFNIQNALCAIGCSAAIGIPRQECIEHLRSFNGASGRMEQVDAEQSFTVIIDFTVTPNAYKKTLSTIQSCLPEGKKLLVLTGSCGDRMKEKRPQVGSICSEYADVTVVTNEDPYTEDPEKIIDDVWGGIDQTKTEAHRISDRKEAMSFLFNEANDGDIVLLCGKGADTTMWVKSGQIPWSEKEIALELLGAL